MKKRYAINLSMAEQEQLTTLVHKGKESARKINRARVLLLSNEGKTDREIMNTLGVTMRTVQRIRQNYFLVGLNGVLEEKSRSGRPLILNDKGEATLIALACSLPPEGRIVWTMQMLADKMIALNVVDSISDETVRRHLKKTSLNLGKKNTGKSRL